MTDETTNAKRAEFARVAAEAFMKATGCGLEDAVADLVCDLCHLAKQEGMNPLDEVARGINHYACEEIDPPEGMSHEASVDIEVYARKYGKGGPWKIWEPENDAPDESEAYPGQNAFKREGLE